MTIQYESQSVHDVMFFCNMAWTMANRGWELACAHNIVRALCVMTDDGDSDVIDYTIGQCELVLGYSLMKWLEEAVR